MTTASTNTVIAQTSNATFQAWVNEVFSNLSTTCGLPQSADTGQMAVPCVTALPGATNTVAGFYMFQFNDTLQATSPLFIKLEFGTGTGATTQPKMWITLGSATNGAGTLTGIVSTRAAVTNEQTPVSNVTNYVSRYMYNATQGCCGLTFKIAATGTAQIALGGFFVYRSVNNTGATTATSVMCLVNSNVASGSVGNQGYLQGIDYSTSAVFGPSVGGNWTNWGAIPYTIAQTIAGTVGQVFPIFQYAPTASVPGLGITNATAMCILTEIPIGATVTTTILGSTSLTYMSVGSMFGINALCQPSYGTTTFGVLMLWQ